MHKACNEVGIFTTEDFNSGLLNGCQYCSTTIDPKTSKREFSQISFLDAALAKYSKNLAVLTSITTLANVWLQQTFDQNDI